jgi:signal transduction histidine kinase
VTAPFVSSPNPSPRLLVVDDDEGLLVLMAEALTAEHYTVNTARSARAAREWLERNTPDLMILDLKLPDGAGPALIAQLRKTAPVPFVIVTGQGDEKVAVETMKQGALDYVMKDTGLIDLLPAVVKRALNTVGQQQALTRAQVEHRRLEREILAVSERERHSIGADLHDNLGQQLTALELMCAALKEEAAPHPALARRLDAMGRMLREAITQTRFLARGLVPVGSDPDALQIGLAELAESITALGRAHCRLDCPAPVAVTDPFIADHLYRIAQEAVNNAVKHAHARQITIRLVQARSELTLEISDDGAGLPKRDGGALPTNGLGLGVMQHRARAIGAELAIASKRGGGVSISCRLPPTK